MVSDLILYIQANLNWREQILFTAIVLLVTIMLYKIDKKIEDKE